MQRKFQNFAEWVSHFAGTVVVFIAAVIITLMWLIIGPLMQFSNTWQLIISTISSVVTFLMVFLIQFAQNKDTKALHLKIDELIRSNKEAKNTFVNIEKKPDEVLNSEIEKFDKLKKNKSKE